jgi:hypothetical protein
MIAADAVNQRLYYGTSQIVADFAEVSVANLGRWRVCGKCYRGAETIQRGLVRSLCETDKLTDTQTTNAHANTTEVSPTYTTHMFSLFPVSFFSFYLSDDIEFRSSFQREWRNYNEIINSVGSDIFTNKIIKCWHLAENFCR